MDQFRYSQYAMLYEAAFGEPSVFGPHHQMGAMSGRQALENVMASPAYKDWERRLKQRGPDFTEIRKHRQD